MGEVPISSSVGASALLHVSSVFRAPSDLTRLTIIIVTTSDPV